LLAAGSERSSSRASSPTLRSPSVQEHLDGEQKKVKELLERLVDAPQPEPSA
jgi:hypothetical protein